MTTGFNPLRKIGAELAIHILGSMGVLWDIQCGIISPLLGIGKEADH